MTSTSTIIRDENFYTLTQTYLSDRSQLPPDLRETPIGEWDVSRVTDMEGAFYTEEGCDFNEPINDWDVSQVRSMMAMFGNCVNFNQPLNTWDVSQVIDMTHMFHECHDFNQSLNAWGGKVGRVTSMRNMFTNCKKFNQPLDRWDVSSVTDFTNLFRGCAVFNRPLNTWNVSRAENMMYMFSGCEKFNHPLDRWDVSRVTDMSMMFQGCERFNQPIGNWDIRQVERMHAMFQRCRKFDQSLTRWDITEEVLTSEMFEGCRIRESYRPGHPTPPSSDVTRRIMRHFYEIHHRDLPTDLSKKCNGETHCPITGISLKRLQRMKRLVVLEGNCFSFYAFSHPHANLNKNPMTNLPWKNPHAVAPILDVIRNHKDFLNREAEDLPVETLKTPPRHTVRYSHRPNRDRTLRESRSLSMTLRSPPMKSRNTRRLRSV
jgi:surface protein